MSNGKRAIALGNFDGLHIGHMAVITDALSQQKHFFTPAVLLLEPMPSSVLREAPTKQLMINDEKERLLRGLGLEIIKKDFNGIRDFSPQKFFSEVLLGELNAGALSCGENYHFGVNGSGSSLLLKKMCAENGVRLGIAAPQRLDSAVISSTAIRSALENGQIETANKMLGREFGYRLKVVHGDHIGGRVLGCPTINQLFPEEMIVPKYGVYASQTFVGGKWMRSVTNIGRRPSFKSDEQRSETHIIGYEGDLYGQIVEVRLCKYKRGEKKFNSLDELKEQLEIDRM